MRSLIQTEPVGQLLQSIEGEYATLRPAGLAQSWRPANEQARNTMSQFVDIFIESDQAHVTWRNGRATWERSMSRIELESEIERLAPGLIARNLGRGSQATCHRIDHSPA